MTSIAEVGRGACRREVGYRQNLEFSIVPWVVFRTELVHDSKTSFSRRMLTNPFQTVTRPFLWLNARLLIAKTDTAALATITATTSPERTL